jgi:hypothetical protein
MRPNIVNPLISLAVLLLSEQRSVGHALKVRADLVGHTRPVLGVAFSPDKKVPGFRIVGRYRQTLECGDGR